MSAGKASDANFLDPFVFETYGPLDAEAFIESQFSYALNGQEELYNSDPSGTQDVRKSEMELQIEGACASDFHVAFVGIFRWPNPSEVGRDKPNFMEKRALMSRLSPNPRGG